jgi:MOSC domain-containing protein YiiM
MPAKILSLQVGLPRTVNWHDHLVETGIFKSPVAGPVRLRKLNLDGDRQADLTVHGGPDKAVYVYPSEHYAYWKSELPGVELPWGAFGENFTSQGLDEDSVHVGDRFQIGTAQVVAVQPRMPCYKLGVKFGRDDMVKRFLKSMRLGIYLRVLIEGVVSPGDEFISLHRDEHQVKVLDIVRLYIGATTDRALLRRALSTKFLPEGWRETLSPR